MVKRNGERMHPCLTPESRKAGDDLDAGVGEERFKGVLNRSRCCSASISSKLMVCERYQKLS